MNNKVQFEVTARVEVALKKLAKAQIPIGAVKIDGAKVRFSVNREYIQKVFAIFKHPCYNTVIRRKSAKMRLADLLKKRFGLIVGGVVFLATCIISQSLVLKVSVTGNAPYLAEQVLSIAAECGVREFTSCSKLDKPLLSSRVTALENVEFCSVTRRGWALVIDVHAQAQENNEVNYSPFKAERAGTITKLTALCGTPEKALGDNVSVGDVIIANYETTADGERVKCLAAGYAEIEVLGSLSLFYESKSEENERQALSAPSLYSDNVTAKSLKITPCEGGYYYVVEFTYLHTQAWNMD